MVGQRLIDRHGRKLRFCPRFNRWLAWNGQRNQMDESGEVDRMAVETIDSMKAHAAIMQEKAAAAKLFRHALASESNRKIKDMIERASKEEGVFVAPDDLDRDPWLFNVQNGTIDLRDAELRPHRQADLITKLAPVPYEPAATCPGFHTFMDRIFDGNQGLIDFMQRLTGYTLTGDTSERSMCICYGIGANGKSTYLSIIRHLLGDYAIQTPAGALMAKRSEGVPNDIARMKGARFVAAVETEEGRRLAEALIKQLTGGEDMISARFMRAEWFDFKPEFKLWVATNHKPEVRGTDDAVWDRLKLIPFNVRIPEGERDKGLIERLKAEAPGILAWAVRGCLDWQRSGLNAPPEVTAATQGYRQEMDRLGDFIAEACIVGPELIAPATPLYENYKIWCQLRSEDAMTQTRFGRQLEEKGYRAEREGSGRTIRRGIGIRVSESAEGFSNGPDSSNHFSV